MNFSVYGEMCSKIMSKIPLCALLAQVTFNGMYLMVAFAFWC